MLHGVLFEADDYLADSKKPTQNSRLGSVTTDRSGQIRFTEQAGNNIGEVSGSSFGSRADGQRRVCVPPHPASMAMAMTPRVTTKMRRKRTISSAMHTRMEVREVSFESLAVGIPRAPVYSSCRIALESEVRPP